MSAGDLRSGNPSGSETLAEHRVPGSVGICPKFAYGMKSGGWPEKCHWTYREILSKLAENSSNTDTWARTPVMDSGKKPA